MIDDIRKQFVVTADDYGIRQTAEPILRLVHEKKIDRVAVLIHYVSNEQAQALIATGVKIDLHLELIDILKSGSDEYGSAFVRIVNFLWRYSCGDVTAVKAHREWHDQVERFHRLFGRMPDGINTHEHLHFFPGLFRSFLKIAEIHNIEYVRFGKQGMLVRLHKAWVGRILSLLWGRCRRSYERAAIASSDYMVSLDWISDFNRFARRLPSGTVELVTHPEREEEYRMLLDNF